MDSGRYIHNYKAFCENFYLPNVYEGEKDLTQDAHTSLVENSSFYSLSFW